MTGVPRLSGLRVYPVKSCAGVDLESASVGDRGLEHDRRWMVVDEEGRFLTQREHPAMCRIRPRLEAGALRLEAPGAEALAVEPGSGGNRIEVEVWSDRCAGIDQGEAAARWLRDVLGVACRLVRQPDDARRTVAPDHARRPDDRISFADGFPFLLTSAASLRDLNRRLDAPLPMDRFRPNLVVAGAEAWAEDGWQQIRIGGVRFDVAKPCARCVVTTVDQETGEKGSEPLRTLAAFRRGEEGVEFGQNLVHHGPGRLESGMAVEVVERR